MEYTSLGRTGERLSQVGLGTWQLGTNEAIETDALNAGFDSGINFVDTAEIYGTEPIVAKAIAGRKGIFVATKVFPSHFRHDDVIRACDASLRKLGVKQIGLYQLHWPSGGIPIRETMGAMERLVKDGKIRHIGVSNFSVPELSEAQDAMKENEIVSNQVEYSVLVRDPEVGLADYCRKERISIIAYSPLSRGKIFDQKYGRLAVFLSGIGARHGKTPTQVALNWLISKGNVIPIPKASTRDHVLEIAGACGWKLGKKEMQEMDAFLRDYKRAPLAGFVKHAIKGSSFAGGAIGWVGGKLGMGRRDRP